MAILSPSVSMSDTNSKGSFRHVGENYRQCKVIFIMRSPYGHALPIKALFLLASLSASSTYGLYASSPPPSRLNIIFDLEMELFVIFSYNRSDHAGNAQISSRYDRGIFRICRLESHYFPFSAEILHRPVAIYFG